MTLAGANVAESVAILVARDVTDDLAAVGARAPLLRSYVAIG